MQQGWIIAYITIVIMVTHGSAVNLRASVVPTSSRVDGKQDVQVILNYVNQDSNTVLIYPWYVPNGELRHPIFKVTLDGNSVAYVGAMVKRRVPAVKDMISLQPGQGISTVVELSPAYNMTKTGKYTIQVNLDDGEITSDPVTLHAEGRANERIGKTVEIDPQVKATYSFVGCKSNQQSTLISAVKSAQKYASSSLSYLQGLQSSSPRYTTWFGTYSFSNLVILRTHFTNINSVVSSKPMTFDCTCTEDGTYAYVYPNSPYKIYLCPEFWPSPMSGTDSMGGTLVHETSHFTIVAGTKDYAYGQGGCQALAKRNPSQAISNADSHQYFAENNPKLA